ncbi:TIR domain-containing protein [Murinocardiopsis flavida]|uniref:TIR domain-containing protein n=1 Tax=Murinocardiopsis flavida TaxID=645275 RepID=A0A2P8DMS9_9ACTN|nr:toll/interleukin-1 receptor domain-containing protein [Murinocardiopsis flavida]PSK98522.1 TIR domain-containing protein [Murinocardiopsis flavida]
MTTKEFIRVFISYSHDDEDHRFEIANLAQELRKRGIDAWIDLFDEAPPPPSWPLWMYEQIEISDYVILVATETYLRRHLGREVPGRGVGVKWEGSVITADIYHAESDPAKFVPVIVSPSDYAYIPPPFRLTSYYDIGNSENWNLDSLVRRLKGQPTIIPALVKSEESTSNQEREDTVFDQITSMIESGERVEAKGRLECIIGSGSMPDDARAAFILGSLHHEDELYSLAISAYRRVLDYGEASGLAELASQNLQIVLETMNSHYGDGGPVAAAREWLGLVQLGRIKELWPRIDKNTRTVLSQAWVIANESHPRLIGLNQEELAERLSQARPKGNLSKQFLATQLSEFKDAYRQYDPETWGAAEKPRRFKIDYELVIINNGNPGRDSFLGTRNATARIPSSNEATD